ncbi:MAG: hypothetical protein WBB07_23075 [Mycobacterium sp.]
MSVSHRCAVFGRRTCAVLAVTSAALHAVMLAHTDSPGVAVLMLLMAAVCLYCAWELWYGGSVRAWLLVALMNLGMVAVHVTGAGHQHGAPFQPTQATPPSPMMTIATVIALIEVAAAVGVLCFQTRGHAARLTAGRGELA